MKEKGALGPGQMLAVDLEEGSSTTTRRSRTGSRASQPFGDWVGKIIELDEALAKAPSSAIFTGAELRRRQIAAGYTMEELELILAPMVEDGKEAVGSMGDDTPLAVLSRPVPAAHHFFRQNFSQVTNPPIDSLREDRVMSLKTRFGNLGNILDEDPVADRHPVLDSPFLTNAQFDANVRQLRRADGARSTAPSRSGTGEGGAAEGARAHPRARPRTPCARAQPHRPDRRASGRRARCRSR